MSSALVNAFTRPLTSSLPPTPAIFPERETESSRAAERKQTLRALLVALNASPSQGDLENLSKIAVCLEQLSEDVEEEALKSAVTFKLLVNLYANALEAYLDQAMQADAEAEWWRDIERSRFRALLYLFQTLPLRLSNLTRTILDTLRVRRLPIRFSSLSQILPSPKTFQPGSLTTALFPHLKHHSLPVTTCALLYPYYAVKRPEAIANTVLTMIFNCIRSMASFFSLPVELAKQEVEFKCRELETIRDQRAEVLGRLAFLRGVLISHMDAQPQDLQSMALLLIQTIEGDKAMSIKPQDSVAEPFPIIVHLSSFLSTCRKEHEGLLANLRRPSRFVQLWPKLFLLPPLFLYALRYLYASRADIAQVAQDACETVVGFVRGWLIEPLKDVLRTVRAGGEDSIIIRREAVDADLHSLERMALSLAKDELNYGPEQLQDLSQKIKVGDLTPVLEIYEEGIKRPIKSALMGSLLRSVLVQVQKAKVDIDQTLTGIDKLLKSQELTFAFVGVAPAFAIVYLVGGSVISLYTGGRGRGKYGGTAKRAAVLTIMRRIERLLVSQPIKKGYSPQIHEESNSSPAIAPLTAGLLLLAMARLRIYAETYLPVGSRIREGFLEDLSDLEDPYLGRREKLFVINRMWRCWSPVLGWNSETILK